MNTLIIRRVVVISLIIFFGFLMSHCRFEPPPVAGPPDPRFLGCFTGSGNWDGIGDRIDLRLAGDNELLHGILEIRMSGQLTAAYALEGKVEMDLAKLQGTNVLSPDRQDTITASPESDSTLRLQINDGPESPPLSRCP